MRTLVIAAALLAVGCVPKETLPTYPVMSPAASLAILHGRAAQIDSASGEGSIALKQKTGRSARLDAVFAIAPPDKARVRASVFNQAIFDLTVTPEGTYVFIQREPGGGGEITNATRDAGKFVRQWISLVRGDVPTENATITDSPQTITVSRPIDNGVTLVTEIERSTLVVRTHRLLDSAGKERFVMKLDRYKSFGKTLWPARLVGTSETGTITVETRSLKTDGLPQNAFVPPKRAKKVE